MYIFRRCIKCMQAHFLLGYTFFKKNGSEIYVCILVTSGHFGKIGTNMGVIAEVNKSVVCLRYWRAAKADFKNWVMLCS